MEPNAGTKNIDEQSEVIDYGTLFYDKSELTNIFGVSDMIKGVTGCSSTRTLIILS